MKMPEKISENMIAPCGVNCLACGARLDKKNPCPGCRAPEEQITRKSCRNCEKKNCAFDQSLRWCFECEQFPCQRINSLNNTYRQKYDVDLVQNGNDAKQDMVTFLRKQAERFTCKACGGIIDQHRRKCSECGSTDI